LKGNGSSQGKGEKNKATGSLVKAGKKEMQKGDQLPTQRRKKGGKAHLLSEGGKKKKEPAPSF